MNKYIKLIGTYVIIVSLFFLIMGLVQYIPNSWYHNNMVSAVESIEHQGPYWILSYGISLDNYTDLLALGVANHADSSHPLVSGIKNEFAIDQEQDFANLRGIKKELLGQPTNYSEETRYGSGVSALLKLLLIFMTLEEIRTGFFMICMSLFLILLYKLYRKFGIYISMSFGISYVGTGFILESMSISCFTDIFITLLFMLYICNKQNIDNLDIPFLSVGIITYCTNYLSLPLLTLCYPLILIVLLSQNNDGIKRLKRVFCYASLWVTGYILTMGTKVILSKVLFESSVAENHFLLWTGITEHYTIIMRIKRIFRIGWNYFIYTDLLYILIPTIIAILIGILNRKIKIFKVKKETFLLLCLICIIPLAWPFLFPVHAMHGFVKRMLAPTLMGAMCMLQIKRT